MNSAHAKETKQYELQVFKWQNEGQNQQLYMAEKTLPFVREIII